MSEDESPYTLEPVESDTGLGRAVLLEEPGRKQSYPEHKRPCSL